MGRVRSCWLLHLVTAVRTRPRQKARPSLPARRTPVVVENLATSVRVTSIRLASLAASSRCQHFRSSTCANNRLLLLNRISASSFTFVHPPHSLSILRVRSCQEDISTNLCLPNKHAFFPNPVLSLYLTSTYWYA